MCPTQRSANGCCARAKMMGQNWKLNRLGRFRYGVVASFSGWCVRSFSLLNFQQKTCDLSLFPTTVPHTWELHGKCCVCLRRLIDRYNGNTYNSTFFFWNAIEIGGQQMLEANYALALENAATTQATMLEANMHALFSWVASQSALPSMCVWSFSLVENACSFPTAECEEPTTCKRVRVAGPRACACCVSPSDVSSVLFALLALHRKKRKSWWSAKAMAATNLTCHVCACIDRPSLAFFSFHCTAVTWAARPQDLYE